MANYIEFATNLVSDLYVVPTSRYLNSKVIYYGNQKKMAFNTYKKNTYPESQDDRYMLITAGLEYRPDLVSQKVYFTPDYWWRIMEANNLNDVFDFKAGITVRIPINFPTSNRNV